MRLSFIIFILLAAVSFSTRLISLNSIPQGMHRDEVSVGYNAFSIAETSRDEYGKFLPFVFKSLGDYKLPVVIYATVPTVWLFGLSDFWVRFPTAFLGALTPLVLFFLVKNLTKNQRVSYVAAFLLAISPQHILFSRSVNESTISVFTVIVGFYFLSGLLNRFSYFNLYLGTIFFVISVFTYRTQFVFAPLILTFFIIANWSVLKRWRYEYKRAGIIALALFFLSLGFENNMTALTRVKDIGLLSSAAVRQSIDLQIAEDRFQAPILTRIYHNKLGNFSIVFLHNYLSHFDFSYLFFTGDKLSSNNSTPWMGHLLYIDAPFFLLGLIVLLRKKRVDLALAWLVIGPVASAGTVDSPSALRNLISTVSYSMIIAYGIDALVQNKGFFLRNALALVVVFLYFFNFLYFWHLFSVHKSVHEPWGRNFGMEQMIKSVVLEKGEYKKVIFAPQDDLYIFLLYYQSVDPRIIQREQFRERSKEIISLVDSKYSFSDFVCPRFGEEDSLYVCRETKVPARGKIMESIRYGDGLPAYTLIKFGAGYNSIIAKEKLPPRYEYLEDDLKEFGAFLK